MQCLGSLHGAPWFVLALKLYKFPPRALHGLAPGRYIGSWNSQGQVSQGLLRLENTL